MEAGAYAGISILSQALPPVMHLIGKPPPAARNCLKGQGASGGKLITGTALEGEKQWNRVLQVR